jgi:hypothetical protein
MARIFISYRRADSKASAGRIYDHLAREFGEAQVFKDVNTIPPGVDFRQYINDEISTADIVLVVISHNWVKILNERINDERDFVRLEIESALNQGKRIIPVLIEGASAPGEADLPESIRPMAFINVANVDDDPDFVPHLKKLIQYIKQPQPDRKEKKSQSLGHPLMLPSLALLVSVLVIFAVVLRYFPTPTPSDEVLPTTDPDIYTEIYVQAQTDVYVSQVAMLATNSFATENAVLATEAPEITAEITPVLTPFSSIPIADGFDSPVGTAEERRGDAVWPEGWELITAFDRLYSVGTPSEAYHTGVDLSWGENPYEDKGLPVYSPASGVVTFAGELRIWGYVIIIRHDPVYSSVGDIVYSRLGHVQNLIV